MARAFNDDVQQSKAELAEAIKAFRHAQEDLHKLREAGTPEKEIRKVMQRFGFTGVTPDEFISAKTTGEVVQLIEKMIQDRVSINRPEGLRFDTPSESSG